MALSRSTVHRFLPLLAITTTLLLWASAFVVIRAIGQDLSPGPMAMVRLVVGAAVLAAVALVYRRPLPRGRALVMVIAYGIAWFLLYMVVLNWAELHLDAGTAALLVNTAPIIVAIGAGLLLGEGFGRPLMIGISVAFVGVVVITLGSSGSHADLLGIVLALLAAIFYAVGMLLQKVVLRSVDAVTATWTGAAVGALGSLVFLPGAWGELATAPASSILGAVYLGVGPTAIAFTTWAYALSRSSAGQTGAASLLIPAISIGMSWIFLSEVPTVWGLLGGLLCIIGVAITRFHRRVAAPVDGVVSTTPVAAR